MVLLYTSAKCILHKSSAPFARFLKLNFMSDGVFRGLYFIGLGVVFKQQMHFASVKL